MFPALWHVVSYCFVNSEDWMAVKLPSAGFAPTESQGHPQCVPKANRGAAKVNHQRSGSRTVGIRGMVRMLQTRRTISCSNRIKITHLAVGRWFQPIEGREAAEVEGCDDGGDG
jgi:hypothetical protein